MKLIHNNPYRIAGILSNATAKELEKQKGKIRAFAKVGREITTEYDFKILDSITRTEETIDQAFSNIEQKQDKVSYSLFWFVDDLGLQHLKAGDEEKALNIWEKVVLNKDVNTKNIFALNNLGTYRLLSKDKTDIKTGIEAKIKLIESDFFENFVHSIADETYTIDTQKQCEKLVDELVTQFKIQYSSYEALELFSNCNGAIQKYLAKKFTEEPLHKIENQIESTKKKRKQNKGEAYDFGLTLYKNCINDVSLLKTLLGVNHLKYKNIVDQLANEIMQCSIDYFYERKDSNEPGEKSLKLLRYAESFAIGKQTKDRISSNIEALQEVLMINKLNKLREFNFYSDQELSLTNFLIFYKEKLPLFKNAKISQLIIKDVMALFIKALNARISRAKTADSFNDFVKPELYTTLEYLHILKSFTSSFSLTIELNKQIKILEENLSYFLKVFDIKENKRTEFKTLEELKNHQEKGKERGLLVRYSEIDELIEKMIAGAKNGRDLANKELERLKVWTLFRSKKERVLQIKQQQQAVESYEDIVNNSNENIKIIKYKKEKIDIEKKLNKYSLEEIKKLTYDIKLARYTTLKFR